MNEPKKLDKKKLLELIIGTLISALLYSIAIKCFVNLKGIDMLASGCGGLAIILGKVFSFAVDESIGYSIAYFALNIPIFIMAFKRIGKAYTLFTIINVGLSSLLNLLIPSTAFNFMGLDPVSDKAIIAICAGILIGISSGVALKIGSSTGGIDTITAYMGILYDKQIGIFTFFINLVILLMGGLLFNKWPAMLYTAIVIFVQSQVINLIYRRSKKKLIKIVTTMKTEMAEALLAISKHGITILEAEGAYSHRQKYQLETTVPESESKDILTTALKVDPKAFIQVVNVHEVKGNYTMPKFQ